MIKFLKKNIERIFYLYLLCALNLAYLTIHLLTLISPLLTRTKKKDLAININAPFGSDGYLRRFEVFFEYLKKDNIGFDIMPYFHDDYVKKVLQGSRIRQYLMYAKIIWKRIPQALKARHYKSVFIQRNLFPTYPDLKTPHLEKLVRKLSDNITIDFWDPVHIWQPTVTLESFKYADKISVDNKILFDHYLNYHQNIYLWPIAVDISKYKQKESYAIGNTIKLFYTGSFMNVKAHLVPLLPVLDKLTEVYDLELTVVGKYAPESKKLKIKHIPWEKETYFHLLADSDIGLFPYFGNPESNKWRVAGKTLDYLASGLPFIGVKEGLPHGIDTSKHMFVLNDNAEWESKIIEVLSNNMLREKVGKSGREFISNNFSLEKSYLQFKNIFQS